MYSGVSGNVGVGNNNPKALLDVGKGSSTNDEDVLMRFSSDRYWEVRQEGSDSGAALKFRSVGDNVQPGDIANKGFSIETEGSIKFGVTSGPWVGWINGVFQSCNHKGYCTTHNLPGETAVESFAVFGEPDNELWVGGYDLWSCNRYGGCTNHGNLVNLNTIKEMVKWNDKLWAASATSIYSCNSQGSCDFKFIMMYNDNLEVYNDYLWGGEYGIVQRCTSDGVCQNTGQYNYVTNDMTVFDGDGSFGEYLYISMSGDLTDDAIYKCMSLTSGFTCQAVHVSPGNFAYTAMTVFGDYLWLARWDGEVEKCSELYGGFLNCVELDTGLGYGNKDIEVINGKIWLARSDGSLYECDTSGNCEQRCDEGDSIEHLIGFSLPGSPVSVNYGGFVGIGDNTPSVKLDVAGDVRADDFIEYSEDYVGDAINVLKNIRTFDVDEISDWKPVNHTSWPSEVIIESIEEGSCSEQDELPVHTEMVDLPDNKCKIYTRSLSGVASINTRAIQQLIDKVETLESENMLLKQSICEEFPKFEYCN